VFRSGKEGIEAAIGCRDAAERAGLRLHLGLHAGDVIREGNNVYGGAVNIAALIAAFARSGEILVSDTVRGLARTSAAVQFEDRGRQELKGGVGSPAALGGVALERNSLPGANTAHTRG
jgi:class 3 adenylate cyclase